MTKRAGRPWRRARGWALDRDRHLCQLRYPGICTTRATQVDHIIKVEERPDLELDVTNLRSVCIPCHKHRTALQASGNDQPAHVEPSRDW